MATRRLRAVGCSAKRIHASAASASISQAPSCSHRVPPFRSCRRSAVPLRPGVRRFRGPLLRDRATAPDDLISLTELRSTLATEDITLSDRRLKRLRTEGLLPCVGRRHPTGIRGSVSDYPRWAAEQLTLVSRLARRDRRFVSFACSFAGTAGGSSPISYGLHSRHRSSGSPRTPDRSRLGQVTTATRRTDWHKPCAVWAAPEAHGSYTCGSGTLH